MLAAVSCGREDVLETMWVSTDIHFTDRMSIEEIEDAKLGVLDFFNAHPVRKVDVGAYPHCLKYIFSTAGYRS